MDYHKTDFNSVNYRQSGFVLAGVCMAFYAALLFHASHYPLIALMALLLTVLAVIKARILRIVVDLLIAIGNSMHRFTNPLVFCLIYIVAIIPISIAFRLMQKDVLQLRFDNGKSSYWAVREDSGSKLQNFNHQF